MTADFNQVLSDFHYPLAKEKIAHQPLAKREQSRLLVFNRQTGKFSDRHFFELSELLNENDVLVLNETKVFPARLLGKKDTGGKVELLLLKKTVANAWQAISKPALKINQHLYFPPRNLLLDEDYDLADFLQARVLKNQEASALVEVEFNYSADKLWQAIEKTGYTPLPPYIKNQQSETVRRSEYQTTYAKNIGSAAAPTAGLHFTNELLNKLANQGVQIEKIDLAVGLGTFAKLNQENWQSQRLHEEHYQIQEDVADRLSQAKAAGKRLIAVGTTSLRALESAVINPKIIKKNKSELQKNSQKNKKNNLLFKFGQQSTNIFIKPPYQFQAVDALISNFHLPASSLLMLVTAFSTQPNSPFVFENFLRSPIGQAYQHAIDNDYRFFSFGDAMLIL